MSELSAKSFLEKTLLSILTYCDEEKSFMTTIIGFRRLIADGQTSGPQGNDVSGELTFVESDSRIMIYFPNKKAKMEFLKGVRQCSALCIS
jgi:hypothetical protein